MSGDLAKAIGAGYRDRDKLVSGVTRHLLKQRDSDRRDDCIHPSEIAKEQWCPRQTYYRISGAAAAVVPVSLAMQAVFETGHEAHAKWQTWFREMGTLRGRWRCRYCGLRWDAISPIACPRCEVGADLIAYAEVPVENAEYLLAGQADGDVSAANGWRLIEAKTIGIGTLRFEAPKLIENATVETSDGHKVVDWDRLWSNIRRPFPSHIRQGMVYCFCAERDEIVYIYEPKFVTSHPKEFEIKFRRELIEDLLEGCLKVKNALERQRPPRRPEWAEKTCYACKQCPFKKVCWQ